MTYQVHFPPEGIHYAPDGIVDRWLEAFTAAVSPRKLEAQIGREGDFLWHAFYCSEISCLTGTSARAAYREIACPQVLFFEVHGRGKDGYEVHDLVLTDKSPLDPDALSAYPDAFVVSPDFSWTYVHSHEGDDFFCLRQS